MIACECCRSAWLLSSWAVHLLESVLPYVAPVSAAQDSCLKFVHLLCLLCCMQGPAHAMLCQVSACKLQHHPWHDDFCRSLGCLDPQCVLCEHNPHRRCNVNFAPKYLVNDILKAKCEAPIRVEIIDRGTGVPLGEDIPDVQLEVSINLPFVQMKSDSCC